MPLGEVTDGLFDEGLIFGGFSIHWVIFIKKMKYEFLGKLQE